MVVAGSWEIGWFWNVGYLINNAMSNYMVCYTTLYGVLKRCLEEKCTLCVWKTSIFGLHIYVAGESGIQTRGEKIVLGWSWKSDSNMSFSFQLIRSARARFKYVLSDEKTAGCMTNSIYCTNFKTKFEILISNWWTWSAHGQIMGSAFTYVQCLDWARNHGQACKGEGESQWGRWKCTVLTM